MMRMIWIIRAFWGYMDYCDNYMDYFFDYVDYICSDYVNCILQDMT